MKKRSKIFRKTAVAVIAVMMVLVPVFNVSAFSDTEKNWAREYIEKLTAMGAIYGKEDGLFHPADPILRSEFTAILLRSLGNDVGQPPAGSGQKWYKYYVEEALRKGYIKEGEFTESNLNQNITKIEIARMLVRAMGKEDTAVELAGVPTHFKDDSLIAKNDKGYVWVCYKYGIINGTPDGYFQPSKSADRAEATK